MVVSSTVVTGTLVPEIGAVSDAKTGVEVEAELEVETKEVVDSGAVTDTGSDTVVDPDSGAVSEADKGDEVLTTAEVVAWADDERLELYGSDDDKKRLPEDDPDVVVKEYVVGLLEDSKEVRLKGAV